MSHHKKFEILHPPRQRLLKDRRQRYHLVSSAFRSFENGDDRNPSMQIMTVCDKGQSQFRGKITAARKNKVGSSVPDIAVSSTNAARMTFAEDFVSEHSFSFAKDRGLDGLGKSNVERPGLSQLFGFPS
jgi:hypothetical protein